MSAALGYNFVVVDYAAATEKKKKETDTIIYLLNEYYLLN